MKKIFSLVLVSALGGALTLGTYKVFIEKEDRTTLQETKTSPYTIPVSYKSVNTKLPMGESVDFTTAAEKTIHSVVHVRNTTTSSGIMTFEDLFFGRRSQRPQIGTGSGVIISPDGMIITNNHVIDGAEEITITLNNNKSYEAELIGTDPKTDIALLKIEADEDLPYTTFGDSDTSKVGEWVLAVGNPFNLTSTVTAGIISAKSRDLTGGDDAQSFIQTDAAVNPGNSGGALVNTHGELIGINTAITSQTGSYVGYSFAVPSNIAKKVIEDIMEFGNVQNGILGVRGGALNSASAKELGVNDTEGFYVSTVEDDSGAKKAGIQEGDIIKQLDDVKISKFSDLKGFLNTKRPNDVVYVTVVRDGDEKTLPVTLAKITSVRVPIIGTLKEASRKELKNLKIDYGLKITDLNIANREEFKSDGVDEGSIVTAINGEKVNSIEDANAAITKYSGRIYRVEIVKTNGEKVNYRFR
ncbi:trypsin-like peptidase domain-containing protein [Pontimicrobium aquaticum]|uniref:PDZ domain-containing protein n=1 Tax=Pontimicrobium aquaticum TaxID=2565367 RepID=A0A4U0EW92_9FLAO|nr:trypsin-like peptidase domain-containing protein [Pontimicrobium aquaticum]TJY36110.1 PDZ domain-containing protein [Pontimicrobium aquaticum]